MRQPIADRPATDSQAQRHQPRQQAHVIMPRPIKQAGKLQEFTGTPLPQPAKIYVILRSPTGMFWNNRQRIIF